MDQTKNKNGVYIVIALIIILVIAYAVAHKKSSAPVVSDSTNTGTTVDTTDNSDASTVTPAQPTTGVDGSVTATLPTITIPKTYTVTVTDSGYSPSTLTIKAGDTVSFVNNSTHTVWTASDPHPQHTALPSFDALKGFAIGTTYSYTFTKVGTWSYHDHQHSSMKGSIVVQ